MVEKDESSPGGISEEEAAQYDRQIRLWGLEAQKRLRTSRVLLVGLRGLGAEVAKNLILAGVRGLTLLDHQQVSPEDGRAQFLIPSGSVGRNRAEASLERAQSLNPMVEVKADPESVESKPHEFFRQFDAKLQFCRLREALAVDWRGEAATAALRKTAPDYFLLQVLLRFRSVTGRDPSPLRVPQDSEVLLRLRREVLEALGVGAQLLPEQFHSFCFSEMAPVCAVVGGVLGQELVKALSQRDPPHKNFFFFDGVRGQGMVECLGPPL
uniref:SUMO1 activating enzyme subunit 1 n=1 Tax=Catharus ustulatus TaxID=91951 RepID=A0A8C3UYS6_CATUS